MIRVNNIKLPIDWNLEMLRKKTAKKLRIDIKQIKEFKVSKKSIDARDKNNILYVFSVDLKLNNENKYLNKDVVKLEVNEYKTKKITKQVKRPVVVGSGPAGLFCALILAESGLCPIILERGKNVDERKKDVDIFFKTGELNEESNVQFGEGGAGTFSDGKLTTGVKDKRISKIIDEFLEAGAPEEISYTNKPHLGTDKLVCVVKNIRKKIQNLGGEFRFSNKLVDFIINENKINTVIVENNNERYNIDTDILILAVGHSSRDTFYMLRDKNINIVKKPFSVGMRIEHLQKDINKSQYGKFYEKMESAEYKLSTHTSNGRGVYTFCMCPGGQVVSASSEKGKLVTNGMSYFKRDMENSNSALLVNINPDDIKGDEPLLAVEFQRSLEEKAYRLGGNNFFAPVQLLGDFLNDKTTTSLGNIYPSYKPGFTFSDLRECFSEEIVNSFKEAVFDMDKKLNGFNIYDAVLTGVESRSSSPIRILRDEKFESNVKGLYPCGEGAGYAGGIMSASIDGIKCAEAIINSF